MREREADPAFAARRDEIRDSLQQPPQRPDAEEPLFVAIVQGRQGGVVTMTPEAGASCLPIFSTPFRAADYARTLLAGGMAGGFMVVSPSRLVAMLEDLSGAGVKQFVLDGCPRCGMFTAIDNASIATAEDAINCWSVMKSSEIARLDLYLHHAQAAARGGDIDEAYEVVLETLAHVSYDDPRAHLLLGQVAAALHLRPTVQEAKAFLRYFKLGAWEQRLDQAVESDERTYRLTP